MIERVTISTSGQGLYEVTEQISQIVAIHGEATLGDGLCTVFLRHTSASLVIQENADPSARRDLEGWLSRLVRADDPHFTHTSEGPDDMPAHIKASLTATSLAIPYQDAQLLLGGWQGLFLWEHRERPHRRELVVHLGA